MMRRVMLSWLIALMLLLNGAQLVVASEAVGRLFFTQAQRVDLDRLREAKQPDVSAAPKTLPAIAMQPREKPPAAVTIQGYVKRSDAKQSTVWVNGEALQKDAGHVSE